MSGRELFDLFVRWFQRVMLGMPDLNYGRNARKLLYEKILAERGKR